MRALLLSGMVGIGLLAGNAYAAPFYTLTTTGAIDSGTDASGVFGTAGSNLAGRSYILSLSFDTPGSFNFTTSTNATSSGAVTGSVTVTVGGVTFTTRFVDSYGSYLQLTPNEATASNIGDDTGSDFVSVTNQFTAAAPVIPVSFSQSFSYIGTTPDRAANAGSPVSFSVAGQASASFTATPSTVSGVGSAISVPEPMSLALLGTGAVGMAAARRRRTT